MPKQQNILSRIGREVKVWIKKHHPDLNVSVTTRPHLHAPTITVAVPGDTDIVFCRELRQTLVHKLKFGSTARFANTVKVIRTHTIKRTQK